jgi:hypothetical protein
MRSVPVQVSVRDHRTVERAIDGWPRPHGASSPIRDRGRTLDAKVVGGRMLRV